MVPHCKSIGCNCAVVLDSDFCDACSHRHKTAQAIKEEAGKSLAERYPKYYKSVGDLTEVDVYAVHFLFQIQDPSGAIQHASKKLLLSGVRTGGKSQFKDIKEARDTLTRWLQLNPENQNESPHQ